MQCSGKDFTIVKLLPPGVYQVGVDRRNLGLLSCPWSFRAGRKSVWVAATVVGKRERGNGRGQQVHEQGLCRLTPSRLPAQGSPCRLLKGLLPLARHPSAKAGGREVAAVSCCRDQHDDSCKAGMDVTRGHAFVLSWTSTNSS
jgi:hypothetical protein